MSTISYDIPIGGTVPVWAEKAEGLQAFTKVLDVHDLLCPTWGVQGQEVESFTVGPPYFPLVVPPKELLAFHTEWARCATIEDQYWLLTYGLFDPPYMLTPQGQMSPTTPPPVPAGVVSSTPPADLPTRLHPGSVWSPKTPQSTPDPLFKPSKVSSMDASPPPAADPTHHPTVFGQPPNVNPGQNPPSDPKEQRTTRLEPWQHPRPVPGPASHIESPNPNEDPKKVQSSGTSSHALGWIIFSAFGGSSKTSRPKNDQSQAFTMSNRLFPPNPAAEPTTEAIISPANTLIVTPTFAVAGQTFKADPSALAVGGTTVRPGGPGIVVAGTPLSLGSLGTLYIGSTPTGIVHQIHLYHKSSLSEVKLSVPLLPVLPSVEPLYILDTLELPFLVLP